MGGNKMKKIISIGILILFATLVMAKTDYSIYEIYVTDRVSGNSLETLSFEDDLGVIDNLMYSNMIRRDFNKFSGAFGLGITPDNEWIMESEDVKLSGRLVFDDNSNVEYNVAGFEAEDVYVDEYGVTEAFGKATLTYEATIHIKKEIPVEVIYSFYQDVEYKDSWSQDIFIDGLDGQSPHIRLRDDGGEQTFKHKRKCIVGCEE